MRSALAGFALCLGAVSTAVAAAPIGLPGDAFVLKWTALPTGQFTETGDSAAPVRTFTPRVLADQDVGHVLDEAFASAADYADRRDIALFEMTTNWDQPQRTALQRLRDAQQAYAAADAGPTGAETRAESFVAMVSRVVDGTGRSVADPGITDDVLNKAYESAVGNADAANRTKIEAAQKAWLTYRDAFASFADGQAPGMAPSITSELTRRRIVELGTN